MLLFLSFRRLTQALGNAKPLRRFCISLVYPGDAPVAQWLRFPEGAHQGSSVRPGVSPGDFGVSSVLSRVSGFGFGSLFSLRPSGLPFPPPGVFPLGPLFGRVFLFFLFLALLLHLASFLFRLGNQHCRKPGCNDPGPCRPSI